MKTTLFILFLLMSVAGLAQERTPQVNSRQGAQRARIHEGRMTGEVTNREAAALNHEQRHVRKLERRAKADGDVTIHERRRLHHEQKQASRHIRRAKHNNREVK